MRRFLISIFTACALVFNVMPCSASAAVTRENINQSFDTTGYGSYTKVYLNKTDYMYNPVNTMAIVNTGKLRVKFKYSVTESGKGPLRVELRGYTSDVFNAAVNPYWDGWQYDTAADKLAENTVYTFDAVLDTKSIAEGRTVQDGPYLFIGGVGSTLKVTDLELFAEGDYDEPVYSLNKMYLEKTTDAELPGYDGDIYKLMDSRFDTARSQHRIATYKNVYDFKEGTNYTVTFWYKVGSNAKRFALDTTGDPSEAGGWTNVGNYDVTSVAGKDVWTKASLSFECSAALAENDRLYLSHNLNSSSNNKETDYIYVTDMILYEVPTETVTFGHGSFDKDTMECSLTFSGVPDVTSVINGMNINGEALKNGEFDVLSDADDEEIKIKITKFFAPLTENTVTFAKCCDKYGREIEPDDDVIFTFTANPYISNEITYYDVSTSELEDAPQKITAINGSEKVRVTVTLTNHTSSDKTCYVVNMVLKNGTVKSVSKPTEVILTENAISSPVSQDVEIKDGDTVRTFYWSATDKTLRAYNIYSELK